MSLELGNLGTSTMAYQSVDSAQMSLWCAACTFCFACGLSPALSGVAAYAAA